MLIWYSDGAFSITRIVQHRGIIAFTNVLVVSHLALGAFLALSCVFVWFMTSDSMLILRDNSKVA
jgi:hypothetical protein